MAYFSNESYHLKHCVPSALVPTQLYTDDIDKKDESVPDTRKIHLDH